MDPAAVDPAAVDVATVVAGLSDRLHAAGVPVTPERSGRLAAALMLARPTRYDELYWLARVTLVNDHSQLDVFDRVMAQIFGGVWDPAAWRGDANAPPAVQAGAPPPPSTARAGSPREGGASSSPSLVTTVGESGEAATAGEAMLAAASADERLRSREFADVTGEELAQMRALMSEMVLAPPSRRSRRHARHPHGKRLDLRATLRRSHRTAGDPVEQILRRARTRPRRLVFLCDISGSMEPYARAYLQLLHSAVNPARAEAFVFATRLTRVTRALRTANPDVALRRAGRAAPDWSGGTRIGEALRAFNDGYGRRGMARGAVIVIVSDGWERGDPALLGREMQRLRRLAHRIVWVNPRVAAPGFQPLTGGLAAALPYVDVLVSGHSLDAMHEVLAALRA